MKKRTIWKWGGVAAGILLLVVASLSIYRLADEAFLTRLAQDKVAQHWGRQLTVQKLSVSFFPYPHLKAHGVVISNPEWAQDRAFVAAQEADARFALLPLLRGSFVLESLRFDGLRLSLEVAPDGRRSWDMPTMPTQGSTTVSLNDVRLQNSELIFRNREGAIFATTIDKLEMEAAHHLRNVAFDAVLRRNDQPLLIRGELHDLGSLAVPGASTGGLIFIKSGHATALIKGTLPISLEPENYAFSTAIDAPSLTELYGFLALDRVSPVPFKLGLQVQGAGQKLYVSDLRLNMGALDLQGAIQLDRSATRPAFHADLRANQIDMQQTFADAGNPAPPPKIKGDLLHDRRLPWRALASAQGMDGEIIARIGELKLRNGIGVHEAEAQAYIRDDQMTVSSFSGRLLDGRVNGDALFSARNQAVTLNLQLERTVLGQWLKETGNKSRIDGGRMSVDLHTTSTGQSMKQLAARMNGQLDIRIGPAKIHSRNVGQAEYWLNGLLSARDAERVDLDCLSARLPFRNGIAQGEGIIGVRSEASQLLASGHVDMRGQSLDLRGKVRARSGISLGISTLTGDVRIDGDLANPQIGLDEAGAPAALARIGAAIVTGGLSIVATSVWDGANPASDPCQAVFKRKAKP